MADTTYDVAILGGGTGGYVAAIRAGQLGLATAVIDVDKVGGTCLHRGCIPTKALLHTAELYHTFQHRDDFGLVGENIGLDYPKVLVRKEKVVTQLWRGVEFLLKKNRVSVIAGWGRLAGPQEILVTDSQGETQTVRARNIVIATGSVPRALPGLPFDGQRIVSSDHVLERRDIPASVMILGAGAIGVEFASMYNDFGSEVTLVEMMPHILPQDDEEVAQELTRLFTRRGIKILAGTSLDLASVQAGDQGVRAQVATSEGTTDTLTAEMLLVAVGRAPVTQDIGLETVGVELERGFIKVDDHYRTNVEHVYAIGDVIGGYLLAHVAAHEGMIAVETIAGRDPELLDPNRVPRVTYCRPEVAAVGLTEKEAEAHGHQVKVGRFPFRANGRSLILGEAEGFVKIVADQETDTMLGAHIIGPHASDLINELALARFLEATGWEIGESVHAHPTVSEVLHEAGLAVDGMAIHI